MAAAGAEPVRLPGGFEYEAGDAAAAELLAARRAARRDPGRQRRGRDRPADRAAARRGRRAGPRLGRRDRRHAAGAARRPDVGQPAAARARRAGRAGDPRGRGRRRRAPAPARAARRRRRPQLSAAAAPACCWAARSAARSRRGPAGAAPARRAGAVVRPYLDELTAEIGAATGSPPTSSAALRRRPPRGRSTRRARWPTGRRSDALALGPRAGCRPLVGRAPAPASSRVSAGAPRTAALPWTRSAAVGDGGEAEFEAGADRGERRREAASAGDRARRSGRCAARRTPEEMGESLRLRLAARTSPSPRRHAAVLRVGGRRWRPTPACGSR